MEEHEMRLGDLVEDYCARCRMVLDHAVASMVGAQVAKVICRTCYTEHVFHHGEAGKKKSNPRATLFDQVLAQFSPGETEEEPEAPEPKKKTPNRPASKPKGKTARGKSM